MGKRRKARELAVQVLFHMEFNPGDPGEGFLLVCENFGSSESIMDFARELVHGVFERIADIDQVIQHASRNWRLERMSCADRSILRIGTYEILFMEDIPPKVSIDEAVELGKKFGNAESAAFINGILDQIYTSRVRKETATRGTGPDEIDVRGPDVNRDN